MSPETSHTGNPHQAYIDRAIQIRDNLVVKETLMQTGKDLEPQEAIAVAAWARVAMLNTARGAYAVDFNPRRQLFSMTPFRGVHAYIDKLNAETPEAQ